MAGADRMTKDARLQSSIAVVLIVIVSAVLAAAYFVPGTGR